MDAEEVSSNHHSLKDSKGNAVFVYEDKEYHSCILDNMNMLRKNRQFCDVILQVGNSQESIHEIYAHKVVLSSASPYFLDMFANDVSSFNVTSNGNGPNASTNHPHQAASSNSPLQVYRMVNNSVHHSKHHVLTIIGANHVGGGGGSSSGGGLIGGGNNIGATLPRHESFDTEAFEQIIEYAYTSRLQAPADKVREIYAIASRLKMTSIAAKCGHFLLSTLTPQNCLEIRNMNSMLKDPFLLQSVDTYIRQNFEKFVNNESTTGAASSGLLQLKIEFILSAEQVEKINERHVFNEVLEWIRDRFNYDSLDLTSLAEKRLLMLYYNEALNRIQDCSEAIEITPSAEELEAIEDYKKLSKRISHSNLMRSASSSTDNIHGSTCAPVKDKTSVPSKPRQFLFTRSDSDSSLSSIADNDDNEHDWKLLANCRIGKHTLAALVTICGQLCLLSLKLRINSSAKNNGHPNSTCKSASQSGSESETKSDYCLIPPMSSPRCAVGTAELGGKLFVCGGYDRGECLKTVEVYDTVTNKWQTLQHMQVPRGRFAIAVVNDKVYAIGGCDGQNELNSAELYDSITLNWKLIQSAPVVRSNAGVCSMNSKVFVIGGWSGNRGLTRCDMYDPQVGKWSEIGQLHTGRYQTAVCMLNEAIYAVGGCDSWSCLNSVEVFTNGSWKFVAPLQTARRGCGVATYKGKIYAVGGHDGVHALCSVEVYDPQENQWTFGKPMTVARANVGVAIVDKRLYAVGGFNGKTFLNTIEYFDFESDEWTNSVRILKSDKVLLDGSLSHFNDQPNNGAAYQCAKETLVACHNHSKKDKQNVVTNFGSENEHSSSKLLHKNHFLDGGKVPMKNSLSSEPLVEVEETLVGH